MIFRVGISAPGANNVDYPTERARRADPGNARDDQPDDADEYAAVVDLPDTGNE